MLERELTIDIATIFSFRDQPIVFSRLAGWYTDILWQKEKIFFPQQVTSEYLHSELERNRFGAMVVSFPSCRAVAACAGGIISVPQSIILTVDWEYFANRDRIDRRLQKERAFRLRKKCLEFAGDMHILYDSISSPELPDLWWRGCKNNMTRYRHIRGVWVLR